MVFLWLVDLVLFGLPWFSFVFNSNRLERTWWLSTWTLHFFYGCEVIDVV